MLLVWRKKGGCFYGKKKKWSGTKIKLFGQTVSVLITHTPQTRQRISPMVFNQIVMEDDDGEYWILWRWWWWWWWCWRWVLKIMKMMMVIKMLVIVMMKLKVSIVDYEDDDDGFVDDSDGGEYGWWVWWWWCSNWLSRLWISNHNKVLKWYLEIL